MPIILNNFDGMIRPLGNPQITISPPNMVPTGSLNIPRFDEFDERIRRFEQPKKKEYGTQEYKPIRPEPIKFEMPKYEIPKYEPLKYEPVPKKNFWDK